jgi:hypothetical protein
VNEPAPAEPIPPTSDQPGTAPSLDPRDVNFCSSCGANRPDGAAFCPVCGTSFAQNLGKPHPPRIGITTPRPASEARAGNVVAVEDRGGRFRRRLMPFVIVTAVAVAAVGIVAWKIEDGLHQQDAAIASAVASQIDGVTASARWDAFVARQRGMACNLKAVNASDLAGS